MFNYYIYNAYVQIIFPLIFWSKKTEILKTVTKITTVPKHKKSVRGSLSQSQILQIGFPIIFEPTKFEKQQKIQNHIKLWQCLQIRIQSDNSQMMEEQIVGTACTRLVYIKALFILNLSWLYYFLISSSWFLPSMLQYNMNTAGF